ncbi:MAG TPA: tetratricopeptide repeat protein [Ignavibacteriaceae bacterium]|nr:tetratricopeptide repeat protein [Ignavibacteriaceae bacterium]
MYKKIFILIIFGISFCFAQNDISIQQRYLLGQGYLQAGQLEKAKSIYQELYNQHPEDFQYFEALNNVYIQLKDYQGSLQIIQDRMKKFPPDANMYGLLGSTYYLMGNTTEAYKVWDEGLQKLPPDPMKYRIIGDFVLERRDFDKAIEILKKGKDESTDPVIFSYQLADLYALTMRFTEAAEEYASILKKVPEQITNVQNKMFNYISKTDALQKTIEVFEDNADDNESINYLLARLYVENKDYRKAFDLYLKIDKEKNRQGSDLIRLAELIYDDGNYKTAAEYYNEIIDKFSDSPQISRAKLGYAKTLEAQVEENTGDNWKPYHNFNSVNQDKVDDIIKAYTDIINQYPNTEVASESYLRLGELKLYSQGDLQGSKQYFDKIINGDRNSSFEPQAEMESGKIELISGNLDEAGKYFQQVVSGVKASEDIQNGSKYLLARIDFYKGNFKEAKNQLAQILTNLSDNYANDAIELSLLLNTNVIDSSELVRFADAEFLADQKKFSEAAEKYQIVSQNPKAFMLHSIAELREAEMELAAGNNDKSIEMLQKILDEGDKNIYADKALYLMGRIYEFGLNDSSKAVEKYEELLAKYPNSLYLDDARDEIIKLKNKTS